MVARSLQDIKICAVVPVLHWSARQLSQPPWARQNAAGEQRSELQCMSPQPGFTKLSCTGFSWRLMIQLWPLSQADQAVVTSKSSSLPDWACVHWAVLGSPTSNLLTQAEQAARRKAEEELAKVTESEASLKSQLEAEVKKRSKEQKQLAAQREEVKGEKAALDQMRAEFENELQQARGEMQRAQDALQGESTLSRALVRLTEAHADSK